MEKRCTRYKDTRLCDVYGLTKGSEIYLSMNENRKPDNINFTR